MAALARILNAIYVSAVCLVQLPLRRWTMARALALLLALVLAAMPLQAREVGTARDLAGGCRTLLQGKRGSGEHIRIPLSKPALVCWGYMQAMQDFAALADENGRRMLGICPPDRATLLDIVEAYVKYANGHAKDLPENAALAVTAALQAAFPCTSVVERL
jgi:Rap1a immunity proteins